MLKQLLLFAAVLFIGLPAEAQGTRYKDLIFTEVNKTKGLSYSPDDPADQKKLHLFDLYQPAGDKATNRPLIIWMHGGGFKFGSKEAKGVQLWSSTFAQRGYVCASISYTLSKKFPIFHFDELKKSCYYSVLDAKKAVAYFKQHHREYNIDPDKIILAGNSAGGMIALHAAYCTNDELAAFAEIPNNDQDKKELLKVAGVINFWGAIFELKWLNNAHVPIVSVFGSNDNLVPPTHKDAPLHGGQDIRTKAKALGIPNDVKVYEGYSHELQKHFNPLFAGGKGTQQRWLEAGQFAADFMYRTLYKK